MADGDCFNEELLFTEFEVDKAQKKTIKREDDSTGEKSSKSLKEENLRLKNALRSLISMLKVAHGSTTQDPDFEQERYSPLFQAIYFDNRTSIRNREKIEEFVQTLQRRADDVNERESYGRENFPPSIFDMNYELEKLAEEERYFSPFSVVSSLQYYDVYCIDCCGLPLIDFNPKISDGWIIPKYDQVYFSVLHGEETLKVKIKQSRACFNCGECGHVLQDCPAPQDHEKINANRREFQNKFASPVCSKSRYHCDDKSVERFSEFKPGIISAKLREALGIGEQDVPFYIYKMRYLGYPPGYLPKEAKPSLLLYDGDGNINDYIEEEDSENGDNICSSFIEFPGFNIPLPEGVKDISAAIGMPPMQKHQHIDNLAAHYRHQRGLTNASTSCQNNKKRKRTELQRDEQDMDVEEEGGTNALLELASTDSPLKLAPVKRTKYDYKEDDGAQEDNTGYSPSHPGVHCGSEELELLKRYRKNSGSKAVPLIPAQQHIEPDSTQNGKPKKIIQRTTRKSIEEGEVISDDDIEVELQEDDEVEDDYPETTLGWWLKEPLDPVSTTHPKFSPPPKPQVQLPLEALSRFYTKSTSLQKMSFEDRVMWLDPIYGNLQPVSGRYDRLRKLLGNKSAKK